MPAWLANCTLYFCVKALDLSFSKKREPEPTAKIEFERTESYYDEPPIAPEAATDEPHQAPFDVEPSPVALVVAVWPDVAISAGYVQSNATLPQSDNNALGWGLLAIGTFAHAPFCARISPVAGFSTKNACADTAGAPARAGAAKRSVAAAAAAHVRTLTTPG